MLPTIKGSPLPNLPIQNGRLIADLIYFDGALLSYYRDDGRGHYLYVWCDADEIHNRWLVVQTDERSLYGFLARQMTLRQLLLTANQNQLYLLDMDDEQHPFRIQHVEITDLPDDYLPTSESWYDPSLSVFYDQLAVGEVLSMMQQSLQEAQSKLKQIEQIIDRDSEAFQPVPTLL